MFKVMKDTPAIPENLSPEGKDFLQCCFRRNPADRPSAIMLLEHRFAKNSLQQSVSCGVTLINGRKSVVQTILLPNISFLGSALFLVPRSFRQEVPINNSCKMSILLI